MQDQTVQCIKHELFFDPVSGVCLILLISWAVNQVAVAVSQAPTGYIWGLLQMRARQAGLNETHHAALTQARQEAAQAKQAEHTAIAKATALEKVGCHHCYLAV